MRKLTMVLLIVCIAVSGCDVFSFLFGNSVEPGVTINSRISGTDKRVRGYATTSFLRYEDYKLEAEAGVLYRFILSSDAEKDVNMKVIDSDDGSEYFEFDHTDTSIQTYSFSESRPVIIRIWVWEYYLDIIGSADFAFTVYAGVVPILAVDDAESVVDQINYVLDNLLKNLDDGTYTATVVNGSSGTASISGTRDSLSTTTLMTDDWDFTVDFDEYESSSGVTLSGVISFQRSDISTWEATYISGTGPSYGWVDDVEVTITALQLSVAIDTDDLQIEDRIDLDLYAMNNNQYSIAGTVTAGGEIFTF